MFKKSTVFIIGAGASSECLLPLGAELKKRVAQALTINLHYGYQKGGDTKLVDALRRHIGRNINKHIEAGNELATVMETFVSIDEALHFFSARPEAIEIGKAAIVTEIFKAEARSVLKNDAQSFEPNLTAANKTWMKPFFSMALAGVKKGEIKNAFSNLTFINFNYDRSFEHYLYWALQRNLLVQPTAAASIVQNLNIIRPYGSIGELDWIKQDGLSYGDEIYGYQNLFRWSQGIRTYAEQYDTHVREAIDRSITKSELLIFIGFGYHQQNLQLLTPLETLNFAERKIFATAKGIDSSNYEGIKNDFSDSLRTEDVILESRTAFEFLDALRISIMARAS